MAWEEIELTIVLIFIVITLLAILVGVMVLMIKGIILIIDNYSHIPRKLYKKIRQKFRGKINYNYWYSYFIKRDYGRTIIKYKEYAEYGTTTIHLEERELTRRT